MEPRTRSAERFKYGICLNDECSKCKSKEVQQIPMRKDFVCEECGKELRECPPPSKSSKKLPIIIGVVIIVLAAVACILGYSRCSKNQAGVVKEGIDTIDTVEIENPAPGIGTIKVNPQPEDPQSEDGKGGIDKPKKEGGKTTPSGVNKMKTPKPAPTAGSKSSLSLGYGKYTGGTKNGKPDGMGTMRYTSSHQIESRDSKGRVAEAGDYVTGEWKDGHLVQGRWYDSSNNVKGSLMIGQ